MLKVLKRDGREEEFDSRKINSAAMRALCEVEAPNAIVLASTVTHEVTAEIEALKTSPNVNEIHDRVEEALMKAYPAAAKAYILYRQQRTEIREAGSLLMNTIKTITTDLKPDNANVGSSAAAKMYSIAEAASKTYTLSKVLSPQHAKNHQRGLIYINDLGYYPHTINCFFNPVGKILAAGFDNGVGYIRPPKSMQAAMALTAIILQSSQNEMFGGQGVVSFDTDLAPYAELEYTKKYAFARQVIGYRDTPARMWALEETEKSCYQACESFIYNMNTMRSRSGAQVTFSSINLGTDTSDWARMITRNILKAFIAGLGKGENPIFPNIGFRVKSGVNLEEDTPNHDLFQLACKCMSLRIQPRFVFCDSPVHRAHWETAAAMGCRTCVTSNINGDDDPNGRGNLAFNTISLPLLALDVKAKHFNDIDKFFEELKNVTNCAISELLERYRVMCNMKVKDMPFVSNWYQGHEDLGPNDSIQPMIENGSLSVGFVGLAECLTVLCGEHHGQSDEALEIGLRIVRKMRELTDDATNYYKLNISLFASPAESSCYSLLLKARQQYGVVPGVTDKEFFTNSFHIPVNFKCNLEQKIDVEALFHKYCNAGAIMYVELGSSPKNNSLGVEALITYMAGSGASYGGANFTHYYCNQCWYQGDMPDGNCPKCGSKDVKITAIITGYLSTEDRFNPGKQAELAARVSHCGGGSIER